MTKEKPFPLIKFHYNVNDNKLLVCACRHFRSRTSEEYGWTKHITSFR